MTVTQNWLDATNVGSPPCLLGPSAVVRLPAHAFEHEQSRHAMLVAAPKVTHVQRELAVYFMQDTNTAPLLRQLLAPPPNTRFFFDDSP